MTPRTNTRREQVLHLHTENHDPGSWVGRLLQIYYLSKNACYQLTFLHLPCFCHQQKLQLFHRKTFSNYIHLSGCVVKIGMSFAHEIISLWGSLCIY